MMRSKNGSITYEVFEPALKEEAGKMPTEVSDAVGTIEDIQTELTKTDENCIGFRTIAKSVGRPFKGIFNENHKVIQNIYMKGNGTFYSIEKSTIMNFGISGKINSTEYAGVIANNINLSRIENCYSKANIIALDGVSIGAGTGGIIGYIIRIYETATSKININNCYNIGEIRGNVIGELVGKTYRINQEDFELSNSYYIEKRNNAVGQENATETNVESKSQQYMKNNEFVELLNSNIDSTNTDWKKWKLGTNGYPTFID